MWQQTALHHAIITRIKYLFIRTRVIKLEVSYVPMCVLTYTMNTECGIIVYLPLSLPDRNNNDGYIVLVMLCKVCCVSQLCYVSQLCLVSCAIL